MSKSITSIQILIITVSSINNNKNNINFINSIDCFMTNISGINYIYLIAIMIWPFFYIFIFLSMCHSLSKYVSFTYSLKPNISLFYPY